MVRFELYGDESATTLRFDHTGFPAGAEAELDAGWHAMYWEPIRAPRRGG